MTARGGIASARCAGGGWGCEKAQAPVPPTQALPALPSPGTADLRVHQIIMFAGGSVMQQAAEGRATHLCECRQANQGACCLLPVDISDQWIRK